MEELKLKLKFEPGRCMADLQCLRDYFQLKSATGRARFQLRALKTQSKKGCVSEISVLCYQICCIGDPLFHARAVGHGPVPPPTAVSANPVEQYEEAKTVYTLVSSPSRRPIRSMFLSIVARHVISLAHSMGNQPLSPSRSRSPSYQPARVNRQRVTNLLKLC